MPKALPFGLGLAVEPGGGSAATLYPGDHTVGFALAGEAEEAGGVSVSTVTYAGVAAVDTLVRDAIGLAAAITVVLPALRLPEAQERIEGRPAEGAGRDVSMTLGAARLAPS